MKKISLVVLMVSFVMSVWAQQWKPMAEAEAQKAASLVVESVKKIKSLDRKFEQVKRSPMTTAPTVSKGKMHYESPDVMMWTYESPYLFSMEIRGDKMTATRDGQDVQMGTKQQMGLKSMMKMIVGMSSGSNLFDERSFAWTMYESADRYKVAMVPKNKSMKRMFVGVVLYFDKRTKNIVSLEMTESDNSITTITFK